MRNLTSFTLAVVFAAGLLLTTTQAHAQTPGIKSVETKRGIEVAARVEGLRRVSINVRAALHLFERRGHRPKVEEASSISGTIERADKGARNERSFALRKANFAQTIRDGSIELIFVPVLDLPSEWQGTMIARLYNQNQVVAEEVFNLVMVEVSPERWSPVYELSFLDGYPYAHYEPGMYAAFALGVPIADHPAVTGSAPDTNFQPWQIGEAPPPPCFLVGMDCPVAKQGKPIFSPASYRLNMAYGLLPQAPPQDRFPGRCFNQGSHCNNALGRINNIEGQIALLGARTRLAAHDAFPSCVGFGIVSGGNLGFFLRACGAALIYQSGRHIFRIW